MAYNLRRPDASRTAAKPSAVQHRRLLATEACVIMMVKTLLVWMLILLGSLLFGIVIWNFVVNFQARP